MLFWTFLAKKLRFYGALTPPPPPSPLKISIDWRKTFVGQSSKTGYLKIVQREDLLGLQGVESLNEEASSHPFSPKFATDL